MKHFKFLVMLLAMFAGMSLATSCGSDDDEITIKVNSPVVGNWAVESNVAPAKLNLTSSGNITFSYSNKTMKGTYDATDGNDGIIKVTWSDKSIEVWEYYITGNKMRIKTMSGSSITFTKK